MDKILIKGGTLYTMTDGENNIFHGDVLIENGKIAQVAPEIVCEGAQVIDANGNYVLPGLIDMKRLPMTRMGVANVLWETFRKAKEYLDKQNRGEEQDYDANMEAIIPALKGEIPCKIHCTQYDMITAIEVAKAYGVKFSLEHAWGATDYLDEIVESGCDICYGPIATYRSPGERRKVDVEAVKMLDDRGVNVAMITDSPILSEESLYHHIGEAVREGVSQERAVRMVTINPARQLNLDDRLGSLEVGKDADIVIMKGKLGLDTDAKVLYTMVDGKIVYQA